MIQVNASGCGKGYSLADLCSILRILRSENGCMWDREQTHRSIRTNLIEEAYEAAEGIDLADDAILCEELGDVLLQVVFHARIAEERGAFTIDEVLRGICDKLISRHPHVFGGTQANDAEAALASWEAAKRAEKGHDSLREALDGVASSLPALMRAEKVAGRIRKARSGKKDADAALGAVLSRTEALKNAGDARETAAGELLYAIAAYAEACSFDPEKALGDAIRRAAGDACR